jgi:hypothetical protein
MTSVHLSRASAAAVQASSGAEEIANTGCTPINPVTGLATDYLNHFNEAIMLLEMAASSPEAVAEVIAWEPLSYGAHFLQSKFAERDDAIVAYDNADPRIRKQLDALSDTMTIILRTAHAVLRIDPPQETVAAVARVALASLKPLVARAGAVINGTAGTDDDVISPQDAVDVLMER